MLTSHIEPCIALVPESLKPDARRLFQISPLFVQLMRDAREDEICHLFRPAGQALLPDLTAAWLPGNGPESLEACMRALRQCKRHGLRHLIWWELGLRGDIAASWKSLSLFADGLLHHALNMAGRLLASRYGTLEGGRFCIIGLGKLGGSELNLGSDVDLLFVHDAPAGSHSSGGRKSLPAAEYYAQLGRMVIRLMSERTDDGQVWPVDMRLRPGGESAAITLGLEATIDFYRNYGQTWERAMLIKARPVAGDLALGEELIEAIAPFVYRRYLDYTTVAALAEMKRRIDAQAGKMEIGAGFDVKRGAGGIREIEFIVQSLQLIHGGRNNDLRVTPCLEAIRQLGQGGILESSEVHGLTESYRFWRRIEHAIQARIGEQTHKLPESYHDYMIDALALEHPDVEMVKHAARVRATFTRYVLPESPSRTGGVHWLDADRDLPLGGWCDASRRRALEALGRIRQHLARGLLPERSREEIEQILDRAIPRWLDDENGLPALEAFAELVHTIGGRATWIDLLATHHGALDWLIGVLSASAYVREHIVRDPSWLEWPLEAGRGKMDIGKVCREIRAIDPHDLQLALADLGRLVDQGRLHAALAVDAHTADPLTVGSWLADVADAATAKAIELALTQMNLPLDFPFVALAMGKHGSREMGLVSDLDMVFVVVHPDLTSQLAGRSIGEQAQRLGRRVIHYLTGMPPFGAGFEFDARLRPSGKSGALVTSLRGFMDYQRHHAQTWEHQALCRARPCAGPLDASRQVADAVRQILDLPRNHELLAEEVRSMRQRMLQHLAVHGPEIIDLKHDAGGLVDIEFLAQYSRLAFGGGDAAGTIQQLSHLPQKAPQEWHEQAEWLAETYFQYRQMENALRVELWRSIGRLPTDPTATEWETMRRHAEIDSPEKLSDLMARVRTVFQQLLRIP